MRNRSTTALLMATVFAVASASEDGIISEETGKKLLTIIEADFLRLLHGESLIGLPDQFLTGENPIAVEFNDATTRLIDHNDVDHVVPKGYTE